MGGEDHTDLGAEFTWNISLVWSGKTWSSEYETDGNTYCGLVYFLNRMLFDELLQDWVPISNFFEQVLKLAMTKVFMKYFEFCGFSYPEKYH